MSLIMSFVMSGAISLANVGPVSNFLLIWLDAWGFGFIVAFIGVFSVSPLVHKLTELALEDKSE